MVHKSKKVWKTLLYLNHIDCKLYINIFRPSSDETLRSSSWWLVLMTSNPEWTESRGRSRNFRLELRNSRKNLKPNDRAGPRLRGEIISWFEVGYYWFLRLYHFYIFTKNFLNYYFFEFKTTSRSCSRVWRIDRKVGWILRCYNCSGEMRSSNFIFSSSSLQYIAVFEDKVYTSGLTIWANVCSLSDFKLFVFLKLTNIIMNVFFPQKALQWPQNQN